MLLSSTIVVLATLLPVLAGSHDSPPPALRHKRLAQAANHKPRAHYAERANAGHADAHRAIKRSVKKRDGAVQTCRPKASPSPAATSAAWSSAAAPAPSSTWSPAPSASPSASVNNQQAWAQGNNNAQNWSPSASPSPSPSSGGGGGGGINVGVSVNVGGLLSLSDTCGWCNSNDQQPNGSEDWLNCGLNGGGWNPPTVSCQELIAADLDASGVFAPCAQYIDKFNQYGGQYGIHPIMLASFAMQESTCNAGATGANGEAGLMQIAPPNCQAGNNCWDVDYNIRRGAELFSQMIDQNGGNCIAAIGSYNGWYNGMTQGNVYSAASCGAQQNMDYIFQYVNGWMQNKNAYSMGSIQNLASC